MQSGRVELNQWILAKLSLQVRLKIQIALLKIKVVIWQYLIGLLPHNQM